MSVPRHDDDTLVVRARSLVPGVWDVHADLGLVGVSLTPRTARALGEALVACAEAARAETFAVHVLSWGDDTGAADDGR